MKKRILAMLLCALMCLALLAGCDKGGSSAGGGSSEAGLDGSWPEETIKIGMEVYDTADDQYLAFKDYVDYLSEYYNIELITSESLESPEAEMDFIDSCAAAGCKAIIGYYNLAGAEAIKHCMDQGMYYWGTEQYYDDVKNEDLYIGCYTFIEDGATENGDYLGGYEMGYQMGKSGEVNHIFYCSGGTAFGVQMFLDRQAGFEAGIAQAQAEGSKIKFDPATDIIEGWPGTDDFTAAVGAKLAGDYDGAAVSFNAAALFQPIMEAGKAESMHLATIGEVGDTYKDFMGNLISVVVYDCEEVVFGNAMTAILNAVTGHNDLNKNADGTAAKILVNRWVVTDVDTYNTIYDKHAAGEYYVSADDLSNLLGEFNPDVTLEDIQDFYYSLDVSAI
ncbi:MAG: hypothetical protein K6B15_01895 [Parasporobacterium sp.]|nr:hypothetical protein [Parasporobacterium sp.]